MTPRYKLRTLLILLAILPPLLWIGWTKYEVWRAEQARQRALMDPYADVRIYAGDRFAVIFPDGRVEIWHLEK